LTVSLVTLRGDLVHSFPSVKRDRISQEMGVIGDEPVGLKSQIANDFAYFPGDPINRLVFRFDQRVVGDIGNLAFPIIPRRCHECRRPLPDGERRNAIAIRGHKLKIGEPTLFIAGTRMHAMPGRQYQAGGDHGTGTYKTPLVGNTKKQPTGRAVRIFAIRRQRSQRLAAEIGALEAHIEQRCRISGIGSLFIWNVQALFQRLYRLF
jgi:hypothetical protein